MDAFNAKNLLVFRSAKHPVVKECIEKMTTENKDCRIWLCVQEQCAGQYSEYSNVEFIIFPNGMFNYERTAVNKEIFDSLTKLQFDEAIITYSSPVPHCEEIEKIVLNIVKKKSALYFNSEGKMYKKKIHIRRIKPKKIIKCIYRYVDYILMKIIYMYFARERKNDFK